MVQLESNLTKCLNIGTRDLRGWNYAKVTSMISRVSVIPRSLHQTGEKSIPSHAVQGNIYSSNLDGQNSVEERKSFWMLKFV